MPLASYTVERYRSFGRRTTVELRPLTLLFGYNSAGKSAILRALPLFAASTGGARVAPINLDADVAREATYADLRSRVAKRNLLVFAARWDDSDHAVSDVEIHFREEDKGHVIGTFVARDASGAGMVRAIDVPGEAGRYQLEREGIDPLLVSLPFDGVRPIVPSDEHLDEAMRVALDGAASRLQSLRQSVHWLGAVRASPERKRPYRADPPHLGGAGEHTAEKLAYDARGPKRLLPLVATPLKSMFGHTLTVRDDGDEFALELEPIEGAPVRVSIVDVGEGVSQVLPVLTLGAMAGAGELGAGAVLAIEQPEMHLHPRAERALAEFFFNVISTPSRPRLLVETHSENLLLFVQLMIATGKLPPEAVSIMWLERLEDEQTETRLIRMDDRGRPLDWPPGVFSEDVEIARELFMARRNPRT